MQILNQIGQFKTDFGWNFIYTKSFGKDSTHFEIGYLVLMKFLNVKNIC